jgi:hypothetical protein
MKTKMKDDLEDIPVIPGMPFSQSWRSCPLRCLRSFDCFRGLKVCGSNDQIHHRLRRFEACNSRYYLRVSAPEYRLSLYQDAECSQNQSLNR